MDSVLTLELQCPNILATDGTDYSSLSGTVHDQSLMNYTYLKLELFGEGNNKYHEYSSVSGEYDGTVSKPSLLNFKYMTGYDGIYKVTVIFLPKETTSGLQYTEGDCVALSTTNEIYKCIQDNTVNTLSDFDNTSNWKKITIDQVSDKYKDKKAISVRCHLFPCVKKAVHDAKCKIEKYGNNNYLYCKDEDFIEAIKLMTLFYELYYGVTEVTDENEKHLRKLFSRANSLCCK